MRRMSLVNLLLGIWLAVSPMLLAMGPRLRENNIAVGILAALAAIWSLAVSPRTHGPAWVGLAIGFWVLVSPWALKGSADAAGLGSTALTGSVMCIFAIARSLSAPTTVHV